MTNEVENPEWTCPECGHAHEHWHYNASGVPRSEVAEFFDGGPKSKMINVSRKFDDGGI